MTSDRRWQRALTQHEAAIEAFLVVVAQVNDEDWQRAPAPDKWSPATLALHVTDAYELGRRALAGGGSMRLRIPAWRAWLLRKTLLPRLLRNGKFPRVRAPREIQPDLAVAATLSRSAATVALRTSSAAAAAAFRLADRTPGTPRLIHAYFGALQPHLALRFLTAHTQHHTAGLAEMVSRSRSISSGRR